MAPSGKRHAPARTRECCHGPMELSYSLQHIWEAGQNKAIARAGYPLQRKEKPHPKTFPAIRCSFPGIWREVPRSSQADRNVDLSRERRGMAPPCRSLLQAGLIRPSRGPTPPRSGRDSISGAGAGVQGMRTSGSSRRDRSSGPRGRPGYRTAIGASGR